VACTSMSRQRWTVANQTSEFTKTPSLRVPQYPPPAKPARSGPSWSMTVMHVVSAVYSQRRTARFWKLYTCPSFAAPWMWRLRV
jgi:hypothetical protein